MNNKLKNNKTKKNTQFNRLKKKNSSRFHVGSGCVISRSDPDPDQNETNPKYFILIPKPGTVNNFALFIK